ncbi:sigma-54 dependent transcriptional regulator [Myxococcota bacterium]|nr:sigma-54 dependent transcriptional regulator [Myxococcota bacterium]
MTGRVLVVDDDRSMCEVLEAELVHLGFEVIATTDGERALAAVAEHDLDTVVTDLKMRGMSGLELCERIVTNRPDLPVIVVTAFGSMETAISAIRAGAYDFITKPLDTDALAVALRRAIEHRRLRSEVKRLQAKVERLEHQSALVGDSPAMHAVHDLVERIGRSDLSVLVTGESGTGKEVVARELHRRSRHPDGPFVAVNCAAIPETLMESELFGHVRGAFTDARESRVGLFAQAHGGTLFLDEIGDMPPSMQPKLLRALQERSFRPVGATKEVPFEVRVVAATNKNLEDELAEGRFREDLYWRINVVQVELPPLRARGGDVLLLAQRFLERAARSTDKPVRALSAEAAKRLLDYAWPGNVRELQNCIERAVALARYVEVTVEDLPERVRNYTRRDLVVAGDDPSELATLEEVERRYIQRVLESVRGNKLQAARVLGIDRTTLYRKLERHAIRRDEPA